MTRPTERGRPTIGIDLGGSKCAAVLLDASGALRAEVRVPTPSGADPLLDTLESVSRDLLSRAAAFGDNAEVAGIGVGLPGLVTEAGVLRFGPHLRGVVELPVALELKTRLGLPVRVMNDNRAAAWAEHRVGAGVGVAHMLYVGLGTGIGGGAVSEGVLLGGASGFATEIGHIVVDANGDLCVCGRHGCWELYASGTALGRSARRRAAAGMLDTVLRRHDLALEDLDDLAGEHVTEAAGAGDPDALAVLAEFAQWVALGLANLTMIFDPTMIVLGGGVVEPASLIVGTVAAALPSLLGTGSGHRPIPTVVGAALGPRAGSIGAALLARDL